LSNTFPPPPGAQAYPRSAALLGALARAELRARTGARLRRTLADAAAAAPAAATALLSLRCEAALPAAGYRMQARRMRHRGRDVALLSCPRLDADSVF